jgi:Holliday junction DNA helicase RuvA
MSRVPGVGAKTASRLIMELSDVLAKSPELRALASSGTGTQPVKFEFDTNARKEAEEALLSMGFSPQETELALDGADEGADTSTLLSYALRRLGGRN